MVRRIWTIYSGLLQRYPLRTKLVSGVSIYTFGDCTMQKLEGKSVHEWDAKRTGRMCVYGGLWLVPFLHVWYRFLDGICVGTGAAVIARKILIDQTVAAPVNMTAFYSITGILEGRTVKQVKERLEDRLWPTMKSLWCIWIPVQTFNLSIVPLDKRVLVVNIVGVGWSIYLSYLGNDK